MVKNKLRSKNSDYNRYWLEKWQKVNSFYDALDKNLHKAILNNRKKRKVLAAKDIIKLGIELPPNIEIDDFSKFLATQVLFERINTSRDMMKIFEKYLFPMKNNEFLFYAIETWPENLKNKLGKNLYQFLRKFRTIRSIFWKLPNKTYNSFDPEILEMKPPYQEFWARMNWESFGIYLKNEYKITLAVLKHIAPKLLVSYAKKIKHPLVKLMVADLYISDDPERIVQFSITKDPWTASLAAKIFLEYLYTLEKQHIYSTRGFNALRDGKNGLNKILKERKQLYDEISKQISYFIKKFQIRKSNRTMSQLLFELISINLPKFHEKSKLFYTTKELINQVSAKLAKFISSPPLLTRRLKAILQNRHMIYEMALLSEVAKKIKNQKSALFLYKLILNDFRSKVLNIIKEEGWVSRRDVLSQLPSRWDIHVNWYIKNVAESLALLYIHRQIDLCYFIEDTNEKLTQPYEQRGFSYDTWLPASQKIAYVIIVITLILQNLHKRKKISLFSKLYEKLRNTFFDWIENWEWEETTLPKPMSVFIEDKAIETFAEIISEADTMKYLSLSRSVWNATILVKRYENKLQERIDQVLKYHLETEIADLPLWAVKELAIRLLNLKYPNESLLLIDYYKKAKKLDSPGLQHDEDIIDLIEIIDRVMLKEENSLRRLSEIASRTKNNEIFYNVHINLKHFDPEHKFPHKKITLIKRWWELGYSHFQ